MLSDMLGPRYLRSRRRRRRPDSSRGMIRYVPNWEWANMESYMNEWAKDMIAETTAAAMSQDMYSPLTARHLS